MPFFKKKKFEEEGGLPPLPEPEELPPLPPLPGEEELPELPEEISMPIQSRRMRPAAPMMPEVCMATPPSMPSWQPPSVSAQIPDRATVFVKLDKYRDIMKTVSEIDNKLSELKETLDRISTIKTREGEIVDGWAAMLNDAKSRIDDVHTKLTKPEV